MEIKSIITIYHEDKMLFGMKIAIILAMALFVAFVFGIYFALLESRMLPSEFFHK